ncbi:pyridoxal phosphate-dependent transferase [Aspergillus undulatus]|uniref:pyridoxal phosphate-dependent transferase n=1 Tax=Aspergillus undulatus TaxID=1810928 RepID=UPI003CCD026B
MTNSFFSSAPYIPPDAIFALTAKYLSDPSPNKVNLGQGTYRDNNGQPWVLPSVQKARQILDEKGLLHEYLPILGLKGLCDKTAELVFGDEYNQALASRLATSQAISGTGSLHLAGKILKSVSHSEALPKVYIPTPTWSNHHLVFSSLGFEVVPFTYYNAQSKSLGITTYLSTLRSAPQGSIIILHACAHNPTGLDPSIEQWKEIGAIIKERGLFALFDAAYLGFNSGDYNKDAWAIRYFVNELNLEVAVCLSFAKNMGLYGERVGVLLLATSAPEIATNAQSVLESLQRSEISNPPAFGAKIAETVLSDDELKKVWFEDLKTMSGRIQEMRRALFDGLNTYSTGTWNHLIEQSGMFGFLGLPRVAVRTLKDEYHIYMAENSRISIAGLNTGNVEYVARSIGEVLACEKQMFTTDTARILPRDTIH